MAHTDMTKLIYQIQLPNGELYEIHDAEAIHELADLGLQGYLVFRGTVANFAALPAGAVAGDVYHVIDEDQEYIWVDAVEGGEAAHWEAFCNHILLDHTHNFEATVSVSGTNEASAVSGTATVTGANAASAVSASGTATVKDVSKTARYLDVEGSVSGVTLGKDTAKAISGFGAHETADAITALNTATLKNPTVAAVAVPNVTANAVVNASKISKNDDITASHISENANVVASKISANDDVVASKVTTTAGQAATWSAKVEGGVLSFDFVANVPTAVTANDVTASKITASDVTASKVIATEVTASKITATDVEASKVTLGAELAVSKVTTEDVVVATGAKNTAKAITALGEATKIDAVTEVSVTAQPELTVGLVEGSNTKGAYAGDAVSVTDKEIDISVTGTAAGQIWTQGEGAVTGTAAAQKWTGSGSASGTTGAPIESN